MQYIFDSLVSYPFSFWLALTLIFAILEVTLPSFSFVFLSGAAVLTAFVAVKFNWTVQLIFFGAAAVLMISVLRPYLTRHLPKTSGNHVMPSRAQSLVGSAGVVTVEIDPSAMTGRAHIDGEDWAVRSDVALSVGRSVRVISHDGILLIVEEI